MKQNLIAEVLSVRNQQQALTAISRCGNVATATRVYVQEQMARVADSGIALEAHDVRKAYLCGALSCTPEEAEGVLAMKRGERSDEQQSAYARAVAFYHYWWGGVKQAKAAEKVGPFAAYARMLLKATVAKGKQAQFKQELEALLEKYGIADTDAE